MNIARNAARFNGLMLGIGIGFYDDPAYIPERNCLDNKQVKSIYYLYMGLISNGTWIDKCLKLIT